MIITVSFASVCFLVFSVFISDVVTIDSNNGIDKFFGFLSFPFYLFIFFNIFAILKCKKG